MTSRHALAELERRLQIAGFGHTGTLDPLATGILVALCGEARKFQNLLMGHVKEYVARIRLGVVSTTDDNDGMLACWQPRRALPTLAELASELVALTGRQQQVPPAISAIWVNGERAHSLTRRGAEPELPAREVEIERIELLRYAGPQLTIKIRCGPGTYVRALARDLGARLGCGAYLTSLRRTVSAGFVETDAVPLALVEPRHLLTMEALLAPYPRRELAPQQLDAFRHGQSVLIGTGEPRHDGQLVAWCEGRVAGVVEERGDQLVSVRWLRTN